METLDKPIYFNVYKNDNSNPKAPTHSWSGFIFKEDIIIKAGTKVDMKFWGNSERDGKPNPHLQIVNHDPKYAKKDGDDKGGVVDRDINYPSKSEINDKDFLDDEIKL